MHSIDVTDLVDAVRETVSGHNLGRLGAYRRWESGRDDDPGNRPYGAADAANILYTIGDFPREEADRRAWIRELRSFQDPKTGLYHGGDHHPYHTTAFCIAALELFDALPDHPVIGIEHLVAPEGLEEFLEGLDWVEKPWSESHQGAGVYVSLVLTGAAPKEWEDAYFAWLDGQSDPETGLWRRGCIDRRDSAPLFHHLAGSFHYGFNYEYARHPWPHPEALIDTCLRVVDEGLHPGLGESVGFAEIDWVYCIHRTSRQTAHRRDDVRSALEEFARKYIRYLARLDRGSDGGWNDLHRLFGAVCALAELQQAVPGLVRSRKPLRLVLDRRPFI